VGDVVPVAIEVIDDSRTQPFRSELVKLAIAVVGIATRNFFSKREDRDELVGFATKAAAQVMLPLIRNLPRLAVVHTSGDD